LLGGGSREGEREGGVLICERKKKEGEKKKSAVAIDVVYRSLPSLSEKGKKKRGLPSALSYREERKK